MTISQRVLFAFLISLIPVMAMAIEEPDYKVVGEYDDFELRLYAPYIIAEVDVQGEFDQSGNSAFRILAGYIFGDNSASEKMAMTAPVASTREEKGEKMAMTAPVTATAASENDRTTYAFVMERKYTLQTLPVPNDDRIRIRSMPERTIAVHRYSGRWTENKYLEHEEVLRSALDAQGVQTVGEPVFARYNTPFSLPFLRRNEVMIEIVPGSVRDEAE